MTPLKLQAASLVLLAAALRAVHAHGQVHSVITNYGTYQAADAYQAVDPTSPLRKLNTYGPANFTTPDITCGPGGNTPVANLAQADAGSLVTFDWQDWNSVHPGPVMTYIAECTGGCASFKGDTGNVWVKIDQDGYNPSRGDLAWGEEVIRLEDSIYSVTIPAGLKPGQCILRHEILGLHVAGELYGAQFYPNCLQVEIVKGGTVELPAGIPMPGSYDPYDPGILVQLYTITPTTPNYTIPGGPVLLPGGSGDWAQSEYGGGATSVPLPPPPPPTSISSLPPSSGTSQPTGTAVAKYGQCGGQTWTGSTNCVAGTTCTALNAYYSQCL
ncbi:glycosyl hydrolase family 61 protein [Phanerochaete sordida]|uniref:lytic cellulose monooxygenase (C4-dehydrogenating) n=1 Tax=Phanerochaete sordida TaxID=48140 RepID=A0A9P3LIE9_9APHY|nr:glycosyl hydrolase family 61 protein [Phanerochaete sordida]